MLNTRITELFSIKYPIVQGAMQWLSRAELVSAVCNAGGLGIIASLTFPTVKELREEIRKTRDMTDKPFAVNITLLPTIRPVDHEQYIAAAIDEGVDIIETAGRSPEPYMKQLKDGGVRVMHKVARVADAQKAERIGVDAVTIVGFEAAGHPGMDDVGGLALIPLAVDSVKIPVIAGGGFGDGRGLVAALALGAQGIAMGTRFMASQECPLHPRIKEQLLSARETDTMLIERSIKNAARVMKTDFSRRVLEMEERGATLEEMLPMLSGKLNRQALEEGDINKGLIYCGQVIGLIHDIPSVKDIIEGMIGEARLIGRRLSDMGLSTRL